MSAQSGKSSATIVDTQMVLLVFVVARSEKAAEYALVVGREMPVSPSMARTMSQFSITFGVYLLAPSPEPHVQTHTHTHARAVLMGKANHSRGSICSSGYYTHFR